MHARVVEPKHGPAFVVRPLRNGDVDTVLAVFERLGERSRRTRFNGPKPRLSPVELEQLATVDQTRHVLVAYLPGHARPIAIARLVRDGSSAEVAFEVADEHQGRGIGSALLALTFGFALVVACGAACYGVCALLVNGTKRTSPRLSAFK